MKTIYGYFLSFVCMMVVATNAMALSWGPVHNGSQLTAGSPLTSVGELNEDTWFMLKCNDKYLRWNSSKNAFEGVSTCPNSTEMGVNYKDYLFSIASNGSYWNLFHATNHPVNLGVYESINDNWYMDYTIDYEGAGFRFNCVGAYFYIEGDGTRGQANEDRAYRWQVIPVNMASGSIGEFELYNGETTLIEHQDVVIIPANTFAGLAEGSTLTITFTGNGWIEASTYGINNNRIEVLTFGITSGGTADGTHYNVNSATSNQLVLTTTYELLNKIGSYAIGLRGLNVTITNIKVTPAVGSGVAKPGSSSQEGNGEATSGYAVWTGNQQFPSAWGTKINLSKETFRGVPEGSTMTVYYKSNSDAATLQFFCDGVANGTANHTTNYWHQLFEDYNVGNGNDHLTVDLGNIWGDHVQHSGNESNAFVIQGYDITVTGVYINYPNANTTNITNQRWADNTGVVMSNHLMLVKRGVLEGVRSYNPRKVFLEINYSCSSDASLNIRCANCADGGMQNYSGLPATDNGQQIIDITSKFTHLLTHNATDVIAILGNNITIKSVNFKLVKDIQESGTYNFNLNGGCNLLSDAAMRLAGYHENSTLSFNCVYDAESDDAGSGVFDVGYFDDGNSLNGWHSIADKFEGQNINTTVTRGQSAKDVTFQFDSDFISFMENTLSSQPGFDGYLYLRGDHVMVNTITMTDATPVNQTMDSKLWTSDPGYALTTAGNEKLDILASVIKNGNVPAGSELWIKYNNGNQAGNIKILNNAGNALRLASDGNVPFSGGAYSLAAQSGDQVLVLKLNQDLLNLIGQLNNNAIALAIKGNNVTLKEVRIHSVLAINREGDYANAPAFSWNYLERAYIDASLLEDIPVGTTMKFTFATGVDPQVQFCCCNCTDWGTKFKFPSNTAYDDTYDVYRIQNGVLEVSMTQEFYDHVAAHSTIDNTLAIIGNDVRLTRFELGRAANPDVLCTEKDWSGNLSLTWDPSVSLDIAASVFRDVEVGSTLTLDYSFTGDNTSGNLQLNVKSPWASYELVRTPSCNFCGTYYEVVRNSSTDYSISFTLNEAILTALKNEGLMATNALTIKGDKVDLKGYSIRGIEEGTVFNEPSGVRLTWDGDGGRKLIPFSAFSGVEPGSSITFYYKDGDLGDNGLKLVCSDGWTELDALPILTSGITVNDKIYKISQTSGSFSLMLTDDVLKNYLQKNGGGHTTTGLIFFGTGMSITQVVISKPETPTLYYQYDPAGVNNVKAYVYADDGSDIYYTTNGTAVTSSSAHVDDDANYVAYSQLSNPTADNYYIRYSNVEQGCNLSDKKAMAACSTLTNGRRYILSFRARTLSNYTMGVAMISNSDNRQEIYNNVALTNEWQAFSYSFVANSDGYDKIAFECGTLPTNNSVHIDDVCLVWESDPTFTNLVINGNVNGSAANWTATEGASSTTRDLTLDDFRGYGELHLNTSTTGVVYGHGSVLFTEYADLSNFTNLVIVSNGAPRTLFNRLEDGGFVYAETPRDAEYESVVDNGNGTKTYTISVAKIVEKYGFAHLHAIKANWGTTVDVKSLKLETTPLTVQKNSEIKARAYKNGVWSNVDGKEVKYLANNEMAYTIVNNGVSLCTKDDIIQPWIDVVNSGEHKYNAGSDFTTKGMTFSTFSGGLTFGYPVFKSTKVKFTPKRLNFWVNRVGNHSGTIKYKIVKNNTTEIVGLTTVSNIKINANGWTKVAVDLSSVGMLEYSGAGDPDIITLYIETAGLNGEEKMGLAHICIVGEYVDTRTVTTLSCEDITIASDASSATVNVTTNIASLADFAVSSANASIATASCNKSSKSVTASCNVITGSTTFEVSIPASNDYTGASCTINVTSNCSRYQRLWVKDFTQEGDDALAYSDYQIDGYNLLYEQGNGVVVDDIAVAPIEEHNSITSKFSIVSGALHEGYGGPRNFLVANVTAGSYIHINARLAQTACSSNAIKDPLISVGGNEYYQVKKGGNVVFTCPKNNDIYSIEVLTTRGAFTEVTDAAVWDFGSSTLNTGSLQVSEQTLYWMTESGVVTGDSRNAQQGGKTGNNGLKLNSEAEINLLLPRINAGGTLSITFAPRNYKKSSDEYKTSISINGGADVATNSYEYTTSTEGTRETHVWSIAEGTRLICINRGAANEGVITNITWTPVAKVNGHDYTRNTTAGRYGTLCVPYDVTAESLDEQPGLYIYEMAYKRVNSMQRATKVVFNQVHEIKAGVPYIFYNKNTSLWLDYKGYPMANPLDKNGLHGVFTRYLFSEHVSEYNEERDHHIIIEGISYRDGGMYVMSNNKMMSCSTSTNCGEHRAYVRMSEVMTEDDYNAFGLNNAPGRHIEVDEDGIVEEDEQSSSIEDLESVSHKSVGYYDLNGRTLEAPSKGGIYVKDGSLILVK